MSVRLKVWIAMAALVVWMSGAFLGIAHVYLERQFQQYTDATRRQQATQWADYLQTYYRQHGSFAELRDNVLDYLESQASVGHVMNLDRIVLKTPSGQPVTDIVVSTAIGDGDENQGVTLPVKVNGTTVAMATIDDSDIEGLEVLEQAALHSMAVATAIGLLLTGVISLAAAALLARRLTRPLQVMMAGVRRIADGNLQARVEVHTRDEFSRLANALNDMSQQLHNSLETRRHLTADVAHELRTPVTIIQGHLDLIQDGLLPPEPTSLLPIQDEVLRLRTLIEELHELTLAESRELKLHLAKAEFVEWVSQLSAKFLPEAVSKGILLEFESTVSEVWVSIDSHRMTQAVANLLSNAIRYTPSDGSIFVTVSLPENGALVPREQGEAIGKRNAGQPDTVQISIRDTGNGIEKDKVDFIFDRFYRTEEARTREGGGLGLGLAIAKELVELHCGWIQVDSVLGEGSTFTITLPVTDAPATTTGKSV